jgi:phosphoglucosamine mutase
VKRLFGTDGIRGVAGSFPLDPETVTRIGRALAQSIAAPAGGAPRMVIGRDTRESGPVLEEALVLGIQGAGARVDRGGVLTTPAIACVTRLLGYDAGVVVSASHNPYQDNGIKVFAGQGQKLPDALEVEIERRVLDGEAGRTDARHASEAPAPDAEPVSPASPGPAGLAERYLDWVAGTIPSRFTLKEWRIVLDCAHGAATDLGPALFRRFGAETAAINAAPDGRNINEGCGALHPEGLAAEVVRRKARLGLAFDGDADRCMIVDSGGRVLDGDYVLYLAARDLKRAGRLAGDTIVGTVMTNLWLERALESEGIRLRRAQVGDKYVLEEMLRGGYALGGEPSGHIIFLDKATTGDGLLTALQLLELLQRSAIDLAGWAASIRPCPQVLINVPVRSRPTLDTHPRIGPAIRDEERRLGTAGRLLVRYSGTEPKARIMVAGESIAEVETIATRLKTVIQEEIGQDS